MNFFSKKDNGLIEERIKLTKIYLEQQKEENGELRKEFGTLKELSLRHRLMLDDQLKNLTSNQKLLQSLKDQKISLENTLTTNEEMIRKLEDEINQLKGVKNTYIPTEFQLSAHQNEKLQTILDKSIEDNELLCFKDINGGVWQMIQKDNEENEEESNIDNLDISINLN